MVWGLLGTLQILDNDNTVRETYHKHRGRQDDPGEVYDDNLSDIRRLMVDMCKITA